MNKLKLPTLKQMIVSGSLVMAAFLLVNGIASQDTFIMALASDGALHTVLRAVVLIGLTIVLFSKPPRPTVVRIIIGTLSSIILVGSFVAMSNYHIGVLDAVLYLLVSITLAMESIEEKTAPVRFSSTAQAR